MGNHRADPRGRKQAAASSTSRRASAPRPTSPSQVAPEVPSRVAPETSAPAKAVERPSRRATPHASAPARAVERPARRATPAAGTGRRKATRRQRKNAFTRLPALPTLIGATALVVAGAGAITLSPGTSVTSSDLLHLASGGSSGSLNGSDAFAFAGNDSRARAISRDSERQAVKNAADLQLQQVAEQQNRQRNTALAQLAKSAENRANQIAKNQWVLPTLGYHLTARFGMTSGLWSSFHTGLDFAAPEGTPIFAIANGVISQTGWAGAYGNRTVETLDDGTEIWYAHQSAINVSTGEKVTGGETIGAIGSTGNVTGPHVHIEVRPGGGGPVDPYPAFLAHGVTP
jgi:murein DD-endopeptidase MepM/ murein hydrolase activator NlpD